MISRQLKLVAASVGAGTAIAMGALTVAFTGGSAGTFGDPPAPTLGSTTTSTTAPLELQVTKASPTVSATPPPNFAHTH